MGRRVFRFLQAMQSANHLISAWKRLKGAAVGVLTDGDAAVNLESLWQSFDWLRNQQHVVG
jgi:hypothetical protein